MDTVQKKNLLLGSNSVIRRPINPRANYLNKTLSMIESPSFEIEPQRQIPLIDVRPVSNFTTKDEYVEAMVEDLCDWFNFLYKLENEDEMKPSSFFSQLEDGVILNKHAGVVQILAESYLKSEKIISRTLPLKIGNQTMKVPNQCPKYVNVDFTKKINVYHKRDNVSNFILWCRSFNIPASLTFETNDLILMKNPRNVVVCLLEIARIGGLFGIEVPDIIQLDEEINKEIVSGTIPNAKPEHIGSDEKLPISDINNNIDSLHKNITFRNKSNIPRKSSLDLDCRHSKSNLLSKHTTLDNCDSSNPDFDSLNSYFNFSSVKSDSVNLKIDNSDNESLNSHGSQYLIPKYKTQKPVGRVKIYDCFDKLNFVREKKYREKCDLRSLDERVREILSECQCCETFPMKRISEGKYQWGDKKTLIFVRILRNHVMVRVGGGWDTLNEFLRKHDLCRRDKPSSHKPLIIPQIRKPLQPSIPCTSDLKICHQGNNVPNGDQVDNKPNCFTKNLNRKDYNEMTPVMTRSQNVIPNESLQDPEIKFEPAESQEKSDNNQKSSESSQKTSPSEIANGTDFQDHKLSDNSNNTIIQSNQKRFSRIPVLKKR